MKEHKYRRESFNGSILLLWATILSFSAVLSCHNKNQEELNIATAANMQFAMEKLVQEFEKNHHINCNIILGSSGKLLAQIVEKAPYDIYVSADMKYPTELFKQGLTVGRPTVYAQGQLILWTGDTNWTNPEQVSFHDINRFAVANPKTAPYGKAANQVISFYKWTDQLRDKLVFGESIAQTNMFLISKSAEMGLTSQSVIYAHKLDNPPAYILIDSTAYQPIDQGVVVLKSSKKQDAANYFYEFLFSIEAKEILKNFGYLVAES
jgi:molybdate transport system substrate-binding protein